ncbi:Hypothetical protein ETEE_2448 [Edwardsiella anguillarum ET080813]|uniref:Uncharacterized protein n=1 Tax=Edwardsiella anguillarum ET080813 TaxID=667120 RepID=A0A076LTG8_9GAMM|nr:Hypothetical protein ETEE_2448 [Edwardsiella anguillarum ET080813]
MGNIFSIARAATGDQNDNAFSNQYAATAPSALAQRRISSASRAYGLFPTRIY